MHQNSNTWSGRTWLQTLFVVVAILSSIALHYINVTVGLTIVQYGVSVAIEGVALGLSILVGRAQPTIIVNRILDIRKKDLDAEFVERISNHPVVLDLWRKEASYTMAMAVVAIAICEYLSLGPYMFVAGVVLYYTWVLWWAHRKQRAISSLINHIIQGDVESV